MGSGNIGRLVRALGKSRPVDCGNNGIKADVIVESTSGAGVSIAGAKNITRAGLATETKSYSFPLDIVRAEGTGAVLGNTAGTPAGACGLVPGTFGTNTPLIEGEAASNNSKTNTGRIQFVLPPEYVAGSDFTLRVRARRNGALQAGGTVDVEAYRADGDSGLGSDLCSTAAQTVTTSWVNYDFTIGGSTLSAGDVCDIRVTLVANDTGGANSKKTQASSIVALLSVKG